jgi:CSLREA domain-containing protein
LSFNLRAISFATLFVVTTTADHNDFSCDSDCTLREAIQAANQTSSDSVIIFDIPTTDSGYSNGVWTITLSDPLPPLNTSSGSRNLSINGPGADKLTISGGNAYRIFNVTTTGTVNFSGLTITRGSVPGGTSGGGINNTTTGTVNITNCTISGNFAAAGGGDSAGGGINNGSSGTVNITNSTVSGNAAGDGGGINNNIGIVNVSGSTVSGNSAKGGIGALSGGTGDGGGINNYTGKVNVTNSTLAGNFTVDIGGGDVSGGGISVIGGEVNVSNSTLTGNSANANGGSIYVAGGTVVVTNCTLAANSAASGGGIFNKSIVYVSNSTLTGNGATHGGGVDDVSPGSATIKSSIIALNEAITPDVNGAFASAGFNLIGKTDGSVGFSTATDQTGTIASPLDPKLDPKGLQNNGGPTQTVALLSGSPVIDKGSSTTIAGGDLTADQRGVGYARTINKSVANATGGDGTDIGAFELGAQIKAVSRKPHGTAGMFDLALPLTGTKVGVECRKGGSTHVFTLIVTFPAAVTVGSVSVTPDPKVTGATASVSSTSVSGHVVTVGLTGVSNAQRIVITLHGVSDGTNTNDVSVPMGVLLGDTNNNGSVASTDVSLTQSKVGQAVSKTTFREDVTLDGLINSTDVQQVQSKVGTHLP